MTKTTTKQALRRRALVPGGEGPGGELVGAAPQEDQPPRAPPPPAAPPGRCVKGRPWDHTHIYSEGVDRPIHVPPVIHAKPNTGDFRAYYAAEAARTAEKRELQEMAEAQPMPTSLEGFKRHPKFVLDRHLGRWVGRCLLGCVV